MNFVFDLNKRILRAQKFYFKKKSYLMELCFIHVLPALYMLDDKDFDTRWSTFESIMKWLLKQWRKEETLKKQNLHYAHFKLLLDCEKTVQKSLRVSGL